MSSILISPVRRFAPLAITALLLGALALACTTSESPPAPEPPPTEPAPSVVIDWVDFINFDGIHYLNAGPQSTIEEADLDEPYDVVLFNVSKNVTDPSYRVKDGEAARLEEGTTVYTVCGYASSFRLAARHEGRLLLYEAYENPAATRGGDLLDIGGKVAYIGVNSEVDGRELTRIDDPDEVAALVELVLEAPIVVDERDRSGPRYFIAFHLTDGTESTHAFWPRSGELWRGLILPPEFAGAVVQALAGGG